MHPIEVYDRNRQLLIETAIDLINCIREQNQLVNPYASTDDKRCALQIRKKATARLNTLPMDIVATAGATILAGPKRETWF